MLLRRHLQASYAFLTAYLSFQLVATVVLITYDVLIPTGVTTISGYRWCLVFATLISTILQICILYGLANDLVVSRSSLQRFLRPLFRWTAAVLVLTSVAICAALPRTALDSGIGAFQIVNFTANLLKLGLLASLLIFSRVLRVLWSALPAGIALGFAVAAATEMGGSALYSMLAPGVPAYVRIDFVRMVGWHVGTLIWVVYLLLEGRSKDADDSGVHKSDLEFWNEELRRLLGRELALHEASAGENGSADLIGSGR